MLLEKEDEQTVLVTLYVMIDDLLKAFQTQFAMRLRLPGKSPRGRKTLSLAEWMTLGLFRYVLRMDDVKVFHRHILSHYSKDFKSLPNYQNFNAQINRTTGYVILLLQWLCHFHKQTAVEPYLIDSTALVVCKNSRISSHKVCEGFAQRGKTTTGWFYGFKLQTLQGVERPCDWRRWFSVERKNATTCRTRAAFYHRCQKNMKCLMTPLQHWLLKQRQRIEISYSVLKYRLQQAASVARSVLGCFSRWLYACLSYTVFNLMENANNGLI